MTEPAIALLLDIIVTTANESVYSSVYNDPSPSVSVTVMSDRGISFVL